MGLVILVMVILLIIAAIILILMVMKMRIKHYVLQQSTESHGFSNIVYTGSWIMQAASCSLYVHVHLYDLISKHAVSISWTSVHIAGGQTGRKIVLGMKNDLGTRLYILGI